MPLNSDITYNPDYNINEGDLVKITRPDGSVIFIRVSGITETNGYTNGMTLDLSSYHNSTFAIDWHNCYSFGNGVESNRIRDAFNTPFITNGVTVSTMFEDYKREHLKYGLIYSGLYNSASNVNNLNQFVQAEKITKNINPIYGSIQKLHARDTDLITLCEDKVIKILANKDAVFNADGNPQLTANENVLGQSIPFVGEYGISRNPESFASESYRSYFTDKARGAVMRLSKDGLTAISNHGMKDWFNDNLKLGNHIIGSYDGKKDQYNLTIKTNDPLTTKTVSFQENVKGWVSFKSFIPESGVTCNSDYHTLYEGRLWLHHQEGTVQNPVPRNTFYEVHSPSSITVLLNESPGVIKSYNTLNYEGTQSRIEQLRTYTTYGIGSTSITGTYNDRDYYNLGEKDGWYVESIITDQEEGSLIEFIEKEGKWFNYIRGKTGNIINQDGTINSGFDNSDNSFQGLGRMSGPARAGLIFGCMDEAASNYNPLASTDDGSCVQAIYGCIDSGAENYDPAANVDDGSCQYSGCTDPTATNYNPNATIDDGSCIAAIYGCTDPTQFNYDPLANVDDGSCVAYNYGCTDPNATNYNPAANTDNGSCVYSAPSGCTDPLACNYDLLAQIDDNSCVYCGDDRADNYDNADPACSTAPCDYCSPIGDFNVSTNTTTPGSNSVLLAWNESIYNNPSDPQTAPISSYTIYHAVGNTWPSSPTSTDWSAGVTVTPAGTGGGGYTSYHYTGLQGDTSYYFMVIPNCAITSGTPGNTNGIDNIPLSGIPATHAAVTNPTNIPGCMCNLACNYEANATTDDGSCSYACIGCMDDGYAEYNALYSTSSSADNGTTQNGVMTGCTMNDCDNNPVNIGCVCVNSTLYGCTDPTACNYDPGANVDDGTCNTDFGCMDSSLTLYASANAGNTTAATDYDPAYTCPDTCNYQDPWMVASTSPSADGFSPGGVLTVEWEIGDISNNITSGTVTTEVSVFRGQNSQVIVPSFAVTKNVSNTGYSPWQDSGLTLPNDPWGLTDPAILANIKLGLAFDPADNTTWSGYISVDATVVWTAANSNYTYPDYTTNETTYVHIGCADNTAGNYDATVTIHDQSLCVGGGVGCNDATALNHDANAIGTSGCFYGNEANHNSMSITQVSNTNYNRFNLSFPNLASSDLNQNATTGTTYDYARKLNDGSDDVDSYVVWVRIWLDDRTTIRRDWTRVIARASGGFTGPWADHDSNTRLYKNPNNHKIKIDIPKYTDPSNANMSHGLANPGSNYPGTLASTKYVEAGNVVEFLVYPAVRGIDSSQCTTPLACPQSSNTFQETVPGVIPGAQNTMGANSTTNDAQTNNTAPYGNGPWPTQTAWGQTNGEMVPSWTTSNWVTVTS